MQNLYEHKGHCVIRNTMKPDYDIKLCTLKASIELGVGPVDVLSLVLSSRAWSVGQKLLWFPSNGAI